MHKEFDVIIVGGGAVGLALARALSGSGLELALVEPHAPRSDSPLPADWDNRVYALSPGSAAFLERCGAWQLLAEERVTRVEAMRVYGDRADTCLRFDAYDAALRELAFIVEGNRLQRALWSSVREQDIEFFAIDWKTLELAADRAVLSLADGTEICARLLVGADGANSRVREAAAIAVTSSDYRQLGVVANFSCATPHRGTAYQWFMREGVLALLPLPGDRVSMVWSTAVEHGQRLLALAPQDLAAEVESASRGALGALRLLATPAAFPLRLQRVERFVKSRLALAGDAAHNVHPLAGQGMNLGLRDARILSDTLIGRGPWRDCGEHALLRRYERSRKEDVVAMQLTTDGLQKLFMSDAVLVSDARNLGLRLVDRLPYLKSLLVNQAVA
ncbi:MAG TPA: UbiH/UbiF family hydroxylase [Burkholderiales bacterium]|nr:UbiH/UbiF family hydroxylase [Burkholderiales bacterium]